MKPPTDNSIERGLRALFILSRRRMTTIQLAGELGIDKRTVSRDIRRLRHAGVKITRLAGHKYEVERQWWEEQIGVGIFPRLFSRYDDLWIEKMNLNDLDKMWLARDPARADVVAFLQNPWFKPGTGDRIINLYMKCATYRRAVLSLSQTGRALRAAFGDMYDVIWWDNACPRPGFERSASLPPDLDHVRAVIERIRPRLVLCFGRSAEIAVRHVYQGQVMTCCHPMARGNRKQELEEFAGRVNEINDRLRDAQRG